MPSVFTIFAGERRELGGCEIYRNTMPSHYLSLLDGWNTGWGFYADLHEENQKNPKFWKDLAKSTDLFVFPRVRFNTQEALDGFIELVDILHQLGKKVVYEVDDDLTNEDRVVTEGDILPVAKVCDAITVTTPYLADLMQEKTGNRAYILPNMIAPDVWFAKPTGEFLLEDKIILGLTGSATHERDWKVLETVLPKILNDDNVHLILMGYHPEYLKYLPNTTLLPGLSYSRYAQVIQKCDIILAPLNNEKFNSCKSPIKVIEGIAARRNVNGYNAGAACIASNHPVYQLAIKNNKTGLLVDHTPEAWQEGLDTLIYNENVRRSIQIAGHEWVGRNHNISTKVSLWANAYSAIINKKFER